jgi:hypothetical protein
MRGYIAGLLAVALMCVCGVARSAPIVYNVDFPPGAVPVVVTGTITTDGAPGPLVAADITAFTLSAAGIVNFTLDSAAIGTGFSCPLGFSCGLTATATTLEFISAFHTAAQFFDAAGVGFTIFGETNDVAIFFNVNDKLTHDEFTSTPLEIGTVSASVPEPGTITLLGLAVGGLGFARKRSRGRQCTAV